MFDVEQAPEWKDDTNCFRCRTEFSTFNRKVCFLSLNYVTFYFLPFFIFKHHCRCCGQIFCGNCSSKTSPIPKFGIEKEVRVCDPCFDKLKSNPSSITNQPLLEDDPNALPIEYLSSPLSKQKQVTNIQVKSEVDKFRGFLHDVISFEPDYILAPSRPRLHYFDEETKKLYIHELAS